MAIELNHTIVPAHDKVASAKFFASIFGLSLPIKKDESYGDENINGQRDVGILPNRQGQIGWSSYQQQSH